MIVRYTGNENKPEDIIWEININLLNGAKDDWDDKPVYQKAGICWLYLLEK